MSPSSPLGSIVSIKIKLESLYISTKKKFLQIQFLDELASDEVWEG